VTPEAIFHASAGATGILAGAAALIARKGERAHRAAGTVFFVAMLLAASSAVYLGIAANETINAMAGILTVYFITTAWMAVRRSEGQAGLFEIGAFLFAGAGAVVMFLFAYDSVQRGTALLGGIPYYTFSAVAALCALLDLSVILRRGLAGRQRIARHLWRMHLGFFVAVGSFFPGQLQFFPEFIQNIRPIILLFIPPFTVAGLMIFWLVRVWLTGWYSAAAPGVARTEA